MHRKRARRRISGDLKKSVELSLAVRRRRVTFASSQWPCGGYRTCCGEADGKASIERLCLSPYVEKPLNSKVMKSFVPELRSRKCFSCFGIPMFYVYILWTFYVRFTYPYEGYGTDSRWFGHVTFVLWKLSLKSPEVGELSKGSLYTSKSAPYSLPII